MSTPVKITVSAVLQYLKDGYTRTKDDKQYQGDGKSIQEKYGLTKIDVSRLFQNDKLKGRKTITEKTPAFILEDDIAESNDNKAVATSKIKTEETVKEEKTEEVPADTQKASKGTEESEDDPSWLVTD